MVSVAKDEWVRLGMQISNTLIPPCTNDLCEVHYTFDFAQSLTVPHHARQEGQLYFVTPRKVQLFGVCIEGAASQVNYLIDEDCAIGKDGTNTHGPNTVLTLLPRGDVGVRIRPQHPLACRKRRLNGAACLPWAATRVA